MNEQTTNKLIAAVLFRIEQGSFIVFGTEMKAQTEDYFKFDTRSFQNFAAETGSTKGLPAVEQTVQTPE